MTGQPIKGIFLEVLQLIILATKPTIEGLSIIGDLMEGCELISKYKYKGGEEGKSQFFWSRSKDGGKSFVPIPESEGKRVYFPSKEDINCVLKFTYTPIREDGEIGSTQQTVTTGTITAGNHWPLTITK